MKRLIACATLLVLLSPLVLAEPEVIEPDPIPTVSAGLNRADGYTRELWVGLPSASVGGKELLTGMTANAPATTSVAVIAKSKQDTATRRVQFQNTLAKLRASVGPKQYVRTVLLGVGESCNDAIWLAESDPEVRNVVLIDPPVAGLTIRHDMAQTLGVDAFINVTGAADVRATTGALVKRLGKHGARARVINTAHPYAGFGARVGEVFATLRGAEVRASGSDDATSLSAMLEAIDNADVVLFGELHGNPAAHRLQYQITKHLAAQKRKFALSTEQFERDVQGKLDMFRFGKLPEAKFVEQSRAWPNYADYRPLLMRGCIGGGDVIAANVPRRIAAQVHKEGVGVLDTLDAKERSYAAESLIANDGDYRDRFLGFMHGMRSDPDRLENMYRAQCIKDDTMAESISRWLDKNAGGRVFHINGGFHCEGRLGVAEKLKAMQPDLKIVTIVCRERNADSDPFAAPKYGEADDFYVSVPGSRPRRTTAAPAHSRMTKDAKHD